MIPSPAENAGDARRRFRLLTYGCKTNQYESQAIREALSRRGWLEAEAAADVLIVNTCAVTGRAVAACRRAVKAALEREPGMRVVVCGCVAGLDEPWLKELPPDALILDNQRKQELPAILDRIAPAAVIPGDHRFDYSISTFAKHSRAFIKIQDGCANHCSYCIVPSVRGRPASRPLRDVLSEAETLIGNGYGELVLTGINIGAYRQDEKALPELVESLAGLPGLVRLRLSSLEPPFATDGLLSVMRGNPVVCPHLHLPLQSGDDRVLAAMGRLYDTAAYLRTVERVRKYLGRPAITTDIIAGFPTEDDQANVNTQALAEDAGFSRMHVFLFSPRPGTPAAVMRRNFSDRDAERWKSLLITKGDDLAARFAASCVGETERVIAEGKQGEKQFGYTGRYVRVRFHAAGVRSGEAVDVAIESARGSELTGRVVNR